MLKILFQTFCFFFLFESSLFALEPVILTDDKGEYPLGLYLEILEDKTGKLTYDDVRNPKMESKWIKSQWDIPNYGYSDSIYWVRFEIKNESKTKDYILYFDYALTDYLDIYYQKDIETYHKGIGDMVPYYERDIDHRNLNFLLSDIETKIIYLSLKSQGNIVIPAKIMKNADFYSMSQKELLILGIYYGLFLALGVYNLFIFLSLRDINYIIYILYIVFVALVHSSLNGIFFKYVLPDHPKLCNNLFITFLASGISSTNIFTILFFKDKRKSTKNKLFIINIIIDNNVSTFY